MKPCSVASDLDLHPLLMTSVYFCGYCQTETESKTIRNNDIYLELIRKNIVFSNNGYK